MLFRAGAVAALEQEKREAVVRAGQIRRDLERAAIAANRLFRPIRLRERDRHVLEDLRVVRPVAQREPVRRQRRVVVALTLQRHRLAQIIEALRLRVAIRLPAGQATPPGHATRGCVGRRSSLAEARRRTDVACGKAIRSNEREQQHFISRMASDSALTESRFHASRRTGTFTIMSPRRTTVEHSKGVFEVEWPLFGELSRGLALKVARSLRPRGRRRHRHRGRRAGRGDRRHPRPRVPLDGRQPAIRRRHRSRDARRAERRAAGGSRSPRARRRRNVRHRRHDSPRRRGDGQRRARAEVRTAVAFQTGSYAPDFHALATESTIVLPWDREVLIDGELLPNPLYADALKAR